MKKLARIPELNRLLKSDKKTSPFRFEAKAAFSYLWLLLFIIGLSSCEENMWLKSEKKLRKQVEGSWNRLFPGAGQTVYETWTFQEGVLVIILTEKDHNNTDEGYADFNKADTDTISMDIGNYSVDAKIDNAYLKLSNLEINVFESAKQGLNAKWTIVDISGTIMYIAAENGSAIIQREFEKK